jgi:Peptidase dimerisation domain
MRLNVKPLPGGRQHGRDPGSQRRSDNRREIRRMVSRQLVDRPGSHGSGECLGVECHLPTVAGRHDGAGAPADRSRGCRHDMLGHCNIWLREALDQAVLEHRLRALRRFLPRLEDREQRALPGIAVLGEYVHHAHQAGGVLFGRGAHGSSPQKGVDTVVMAASAVMRMQGVVSREVAPTEMAVVTVGALQAGSAENVIPDHALLRLNVRTFNEQVRTRVLAAIRRILDAEAAASGAPKPPGYAVLSEFPRTDNDAACMRRVAAAFEQRFGQDAVQQIGAATASEDFSLFGAAWGAPVVYWMVGCLDPETFAAAVRAETVDQLPANHAPDFAPVIGPTLRTGIAAMLTAAGQWLDLEAHSQ